MSEKTSEIVVALAKCMLEVGHIGKDRTNPQQGYKFRGIDEVMAHCQQVLASNGVVVVPEVVEREREMLPTKSGGTMASVRLLVRHAFMARDGSCVYATTLGEAMDSGDKASNKAMSAALKYALTETLMIPTFEADRDTEEASPEMAAKTPAKPRPAPKPSVAPLPPDELEKEVAAIRELARIAVTDAHLDELNPRYARLPKQDREAIQPYLKEQRERVKGAKS